MQQDQQKPIEDPNINRSGWLDVGNGHEIYWVDWGNKEVQNPIFFLHGGPGEGIDEKDFTKFNPRKHRVIFHDQRGSGRSTPFAGTEHNTTQDLLQDINRLRSELGFDKISLYGISWGATLSLLYAIENPEAVEKMLIGGIYLARNVDNDFYLRGRIASHFPEVWERFTALVPEGEAPDKYYKRMMLESSDEQERKQFAREWMAYEYSIVQLDFIASKVDEDLKDFASESLSYLEAHYILNNCFIPENYILDNAYKLRNIQIVMVQGRYDFICMPAAAYALQKAIGDNALLHIVPAGHTSSDTVSREVLQAYKNMLW